MKKVILIMALALFTLSSFRSDDQGGQIPSVKLKDLEGKEVDLQQLANGKITVISFWATWCSPCKKELDNINLYIEEWREKYDMQLIAISIDDARNAMKVKPYVEGKKWDFQVLLDVNQDTKRALNFPNVPYTVLVDKDGKIVYKHTGYTEGDEQVLEAYIGKLVN